MPRKMKHSKTKTNTVAETKLLVVSMVAFFAGALAFIGTPLRPSIPRLVPRINSCGVDLVQYAQPCGPEKYAMRSYTCSDGFSPALKQACMTAQDIEKEAKAFCAKRQCNLQK